MSVQFSVGLLWRDASHLDPDPLYLWPALWGKAGGEERRKKQSLMLSGKASLSESLAAIILN